MNTYSPWMIFTMPGYYVIIGGAIIWELFWKVLAMIKAARRGDVGWFVGLLLLNTLGLLPIFYLLFVHGGKKARRAPQVTTEVVSN